MTEPILFDVEHGIARITFNRPELGNSLDVPTARAILQAAIRCDCDPAIRCVVLTGAGRMFCVGGDIAGFANAGERAGEYLSELAGTMHLALARLARMAKPLVVLVNGPAAGAGLSIALAGDIVLAAPAAHFSSAYTAIGLSPDCGLTWLLPRMVGERMAREMIVTNRRIGADEAAGIGLITRVSDDLAVEGAEVARTLAASAVGAIGAARRLIHDSSTNSYETQMELEARAIASAGAGPEGREGVAAFLERRPANFPG